MMTPRLAALLATLALAACCNGKSSSTTPAGGSTGSGSGTGTGSDSGTPDKTTPPGTVDISKLGASCGEGDRCEAGACVKFYGIAGPSGPEFKSCEIACPNGKGPCPEGTTCITIADGPGAVCRPADAPPRVEP